MLGHRLAEEGVQQVARPGAQAVAPEQLGVDELPKLPGLGRRQVVDALQPGMAARPGVGLLARRGAEGVAEHRPGRMPGPARHGGDEGRRRGGQTLAATAVDDHGRIGRLEEHRVAALAGEQPRRPAPAHPPGHLDVIGDIDALQGGPHAVAERIELGQGDGLDRLSHRGQVQTQQRRRRDGVGALVALAPVAMEVEEAGAVREPGRLEAGGGDGRIQSARELGDQPPMRRDQGRHGLVHDGDQTLVALVPPPPGPAEVRGPPDRRGLRRLADDADRARIDGGQAAQGQPVAEQFRRPGDLPQHLPVDGEVGRQQRVDKARRLAGGDHRPAMAPPDAVQGAGGIAQQGEASRVVPPDQDVAAPTRGDGAPGQVGRAGAARDHRRQEAIGPTPVADQEVLAPDLADGVAGPRREQDLDLLDRTKRPPALPFEGSQDPVERASVVLAGASPVDHQIAVVGGTGDLHRQ